MILPQPQTPGYEFDSWTVTSGSAIIADDADSSTTVRLEEGDATVEAVFTPLDYNLTISDDGNGTTDPSGLQVVSHAASTPISRQLMLIMILTLVSYNRNCFYRRSRRCRYNCHAYQWCGCNTGKLCIRDLYLDYD